MAINRKIRNIIVYTVLVLVLVPAVLIGETLPTRNTLSIALNGVPAEKTDFMYLVPKQGHMGPEIYPISVENHENISAYIKKYTLAAHLSWIAEAYERGFPYRDFIIRRLSETGAPYELLFLPIVESEFKNTTVSRSGAAGIWQFMMNSIYPNMHVNQWMDDRRNFWKATEAAVHKLLFNYKTLSDWPLALAAYNCGLGKVQRTISASGIRDFWELSDKGLLPPETINYVPRYFAIVKILSYPGRYGIRVPWRKPVQWEQIPLTQTVDLRILAEHSGVPYNILTAGNGELHYSISPPDNVPFNLKIPEEYSDQIKRTLKDKNFQLLRFYVYTINKGDTLYALARHYGVSVGMISKYNPAIRPKTLQIGQTIIIPALKQVQPYESTASQSPEPAEEDARPYTNRYVVQEGDTLWTIARKHDTSVALLTSRNKMSEQTIIRPGQELMVPKD